MSQKATSSSTKRSDCESATTHPIHHSTLSQSHARASSYTINTSLHSTELALTSPRLVAVPAPSSGSLWFWQLARCPVRSTPWREVNAARTSFRLAPALLSLVSCCLGLRVSCGAQLDSTRWSAMNDTCVRVWRVTKGGFRASEGRRFEKQVHTPYRIAKKHEIWGRVPSCNIFSWWSKSSTFIVVLERSRSPLSNAV